MDIKEVVGIDVGKEELELIMHTCQLSLNFANTPKGLNSMLKWVFGNMPCSKEELLFAFEHTGLYSYPLSVLLTEKELSYIMIPGLEIHRSLGISRGKDDKIDAKKIALYAFRRREEIIPYQLPEKEILEIKRLLSLREKLVKQRAGYEGTLKENKRFLKRKNNQILFDVHEKLIKELNKQITKVNKELEQKINNDQQLKKMYQLITSIKGVGTQTALFVIALTNGFSKFENWRKFACYSGIAPFPHKSGISIRGKTKVSHLANKKMKALLSSCAASAINHNQEMKQYYDRRVKQGKNEMSTLNIIRNKLLARIFAVIERGTPYVNIYAYAD
jgi:transposase